MDENKVRHAAEVAREIAGDNAVPQECFRDVFSAIFNAMLYESSPATTAHGAMTPMERFLCATNGTSGYLTLKELDPTFLAQIAKSFDVELAQ